MVNGSDEKTFYVLHDDGENMTLQQRENTVEGVQWYSADENTKGPTNALDALENATSGWDNANTYMLGQKSAKARMITLQEANLVGCTETNKSCPVWMYDYLNGSASNGGTVDGTDIGYWIMVSSFE